MLGFCIGLDLSRVAAPSSGFPGYFLTRSDFQTVNNEPMPLSIDNFESEIIF